MNAILQNWNIAMNAVIALSQYCNIAMIAFIVIQNQFSAIKNSLNTFSKHGHHNCSSENFTTTEYARDNMNDSHNVHGICK
jgi:hypothetical protein